MGDLDGALVAYENALRHNFQSITAMNAISCILRTKENFPKAVDYLQGILKLDQNNGEVWGSLGKQSTASSATALLTGMLARPLLPDDGGSATSLSRLPASSLPLARPKGKYHTKTSHSNAYLYTGT